MSESLTGQIDQYIYQVILPLESSGAEINPAHVAYAVDKLIDPESLSPALKTHVSIQQLKSQTRKLLASRHDPIAKAESYVLGEEQDLFSETLQSYYPVKRRSESKTEAVYIPREQLSEMDVQAICKRMSKAGDSLLEHSRALLAWFMSKAA